MARDPLRVLLRLHGLALDMARRRLADRLRCEAAAIARSAAIATEIVQETAAQAAQPELAAAPDSYAAWLGRMRGERSATQETVRVAAEASAEARASVQEERVATRALEAVQAEARERRDRVTARDEQRVVDEVALRGGGRRWSG